MVTVTIVSIVGLGAIALFVGWFIGALIMSAHKDRQIEALTAQLVHSTDLNTEWSKAYTVLKGVYEALKTEHQILEDDEGNWQQAYTTVKEMHDVLKVEHALLKAQQWRMSVKLEDPTTKGFYQQENFEDLATGLEYVKLYRNNWTVTMMLIRPGLTMVTLVLEP